ncbi:MAG: hypothetical protein IPH65_02310 [Dehalococcoidia bacterium]|uniref:hypothetical protein n=1 Tax=Candidatus Amarobacter glycogenicus TaxID=3140699 RepID=UPI003134F684|nr:hypothetical protein [Dehalococcoidia bacterium]
MAKLQTIEAEYDLLEKEMLSDYFAFVAQHLNDHWVHWHMRDTNYGFKALEHRYAALGGTPTSASDTLKIDLPDLLSDLYGHSYAPDPHLSQLADLNGIGKLDFLTGAEEAAAFEGREYVKLHQSTLRKANVITDISRRLREGTLTTSAPWKDTFGVSVGGIYGAMTESLAWQIISGLGVVVSVAGVVLVGLRALL